MYRKSYCRLKNYDLIYVLVRLVCHFSIILMFHCLFIVLETDPVTNIMSSSVSSIY